VLYEELLAQAKAVPVIESHEHQVREDERIKQAPGWPLLIDGYARSMLVSAGMDEQWWNKAWPKEKPAVLWRKVEKFFRRSECSSYIKAVKIAAEKVYGVTHWDEDGIRELDKLVRKSHKPGVNRRIFRDIANVDHYHVNALEGGPRVAMREGDDNEIVECDLSTVQFTEAPYSGAEKINAIAEAYGTEKGSFAGFRKAIDKAFEKHARRAIAVKNQSAYFRKLDWAPQDEKYVSQVVNGKVFGGGSLTDAEKKAVSDWAFIYSTAKADDCCLPVKLHTGYLAGTGYMTTEQVNPCSLEPMFRLFKNVKFDLFHIGYPFVDEVVSLAKHYQNVYVDMCWAWAIDWEASKRFLKQAITAVPHSKIFAVGGDTFYAENAVGHVELARRGVATALTELVEERYLSKSEAVTLVKRLLRENQLEVFGRKNTKKNMMAKWAG